MRVVWNIGDAAAAVAALEVQGPIPVRTVVVPNGRLAHAVRRELVRSGSSGTLNGTRFVTAGALAAEMLLVGSIDLLAVRDEQWTVLDFKTDAADQPSEAFRPYEEQVRSYGRLIAPMLPSAASLRLGLLFTETGGIRWVGSS